MYLCNSSKWFSSLANIISLILAATISVSTMASRSPQLLPLLTDTNTFTLLTDQRILSDITGPAVEVTYPQGGQTITQTNTIIEVTFSETIDDNSINSHTLIVSDGASLIPGTIEHVDNTLRFYPVTAFNSTSTYTVFISHEISDLSGNLLGTSYRWSFTTDGSDKS